MCDPCAVRVRIGRQTNLCGRLGYHARLAERDWMQLCCSTSSYRQTFAAGGLTQLEWVDLCARELPVDGVDFDARFFPRPDDDYLAQLKKLCADRCLTVAS